MDLNRDNIDSIRLPDGSLPPGTYRSWGWVEYAPFKSRPSINTIVVELGGARGILYAECGCAIYEYDCSDPAWEAVESWVREGRRVELST